MVYKLGQRVRPKIQRVKLVSLGLLSTVLLGTLATTYADSRTGHIFGIGYQLTHRPGVTSNQNKNNATAQSKTKGSAHQASPTTTASAAPNAAVPQLAPLRDVSCTLFPPKNPGLSNALSPELRKLAQYEQLCNGSLVNRASFFVPTPTTNAEARFDANDVVSQLKEFASYGIKPLVFMEPDSGNGNIDLVQYKDGAYDGALDTYYAAIKAAGITDATMGMWVLLPEGNLPEWTSVDPSVYAAVVTKTAQFQKKYFPGSQTSLLLDSETYSTTTSWDNGKYVSLLPFVQSIPKGLIDSFGLQGFPWASPANQPNNSVYDPRSYLRVDFAAEAARSLGTTNIWFNTGSFHQMYTLNPAQTVTMAAAQRQTMLNGVLAQANVLKTQGFQMHIHLFTEDKSAVSEATDWSFWKTQPGNDADTAVFTTFVHDATAAGVPLWLFDTY